MIDFESWLETTTDIQLNQDQWAAVRHGQGPCLLLAVPGGGKTTTMLCRTAYLVKVGGIHPSRILTVTFSRASAKDMKERFDNLFGGDFEPGLKFSTIHAFAYSVVMSYAKAVGRSYQLIEGQQQNPNRTKGHLLRNLYHKINGEYMSETDYETLTSDISYIKNTCLGDEEIRTYRSDIYGFTEIFYAYEDEKRKQGLIDYDDMLTICYDLFINHPSILASYQKRYDRIQVDEGQDTSLLQHRILAGLAEGHHNIFYVADDDQAIYGFRGASPTYLLSLKSVYPDATIYKMEENYRSSQEIIRLANHLIGHNKRRYQKKMMSHKEEGQTPILLVTKDRLNQYDEVLKEIALSPDRNTGAVLYRNNHSAVSMVQRLSGANIPFKLRGFAKRFFDHWVIKDVMSLLYFTRDPYDLNLFGKHYYKLKGFYISKKMMEEVYMRPVLTVTENLAALPNLEAYQIKRLEQLGELVAEIGLMPPVQAIEAILTDLGYLEYLSDRTKGSTHLFEHYGMMTQVLKDIASQVDDLYSLERRMEDLESLMARASQEDGQVLTLSTIHSAKGLEWEKVWMIDLIDGIFPSKEAAEDPSGYAVEEERRLFYVGMTRAKSHLSFYEVTSAVASPFLQEIRPLLRSNEKGTGKVLRTINALYHTYSREIYKEVTKPLGPGSLVDHKRFGICEVIYCDKEKLIISHEGDPKTLNYPFSIKKGIIRPID